MNIRRPVAALFVTIALAGGPATLAGCSAAGGGEDRNDGTTDTDSGNTGGADPGDVSQGNLPDNSDGDDNDTSEDEDADG